MWIVIFKKKNCDIIFFPYRPPLRADNISKQRGGLDCVQGYPNREMNRKADALLFSWQRMRAEMNSSSPLSMMPMGRGRALSYSKNTRKTRNGLREELELEMKDSWSHHSISVTAGLWLVSGIPAAPKRSQSRPNGWRISNSPHISHTDWKGLVCYSDITVYIYIYIMKMYALEIENLWKLLFCMQKNNTNLPQPLTFFF